MGVRGLETYLEQYSEACYEVNIPNLVNSYRMKTGKKNAVLVVDGMSILGYLHCQLNWIYGGQFKEYCESVNLFHKKFTDLGVELVVFFDGPTEVRKRPQWVKRRNNDLEHVILLFNKLKAGTPAEEIHIPRFRVLPTNLGLITIFILKSLGSKVFFTLRECDEEVSEYAYKNNCFGILSQDTDYVIFEGGQYYLSMKNFNLEKMTTKIYDRVKFARSLNLELSDLPLFATLVGNDIINQQDLDQFHKRICKIWGNRNLSIKNRVEGVSKFMNRSDIRNKISIPRLTGIIFNDESRYEDLYESIRSYSFSPERVVAVESSNDNWSNILVRAKELHVNAQMPPSVYAIITKGIFEASTKLEDYTGQSQLQPSGKLLQPLRQNMYGLLLKEKPLKGNERCHMVVEWVMSGHNSLRNSAFVAAVHPKEFHPGLLNLWDSSTDAGKHLLLGSLNLPSFPNVPERLLLPVMALRYMNDRGIITNVEIKVFLIMALTLADYTAEELSLLPPAPVTPRGASIFNIFGCLISMIFIINAICGLPVLPEYTLPNLFMDGKLFHTKMHIASTQEVPILNLCNRKESHLESYNKILSYIFANR